jgi:hypothetical protein
MHRLITSRLGAAPCDVGLIVTKIRDAVVTSRPIHVAVGVVRTVNATSRSVGWHRRRRRQAMAGPPDRAAQPRGGRRVRHLLGLKATARRSSRTGSRATHQTCLVHRSGPPCATRPAKTGRNHPTPRATLHNIHSARNPSRGSKTSLTRGVPSTQPSHDPGVTHGKGSSRFLATIPMMEGSRWNCYRPQWISEAGRDGCQPPGVRVRASGPRN